jgi:hypothetical protein
MKKNAPTQSKEMGKNWFLALNLGRTKGDKGLSMDSYGFI